MLQKRKKQPKIFSPYNRDKRDCDEITAIHIAIHATKLIHVWLLFKARADPKKKIDGSYPIHAAISIGSMAKHAQFVYVCSIYPKSSTTFFQLRLAKVL